MIKFNFVRKWESFFLYISTSDDNNIILIYNKTRMLILLAVSRWKLHYIVWSWSSELGLSAKFTDQFFDWTQSRLRLLGCSLHRIVGWSWWNYWIQMSKDAEIDLTQSTELRRFPFGSFDVDSAKKFIWKYDFSSHAMYFVPYRKEKNTYPVFRYWQLDDVSI